MCKPLKLYIVKYKANTKDPKSYFFPCREVRKEGNLVYVEYQPLCTCEGVGWSGVSQIQIHTCLCLIDRHTNLLGLKILGNL